MAVTAAQASASASLPRLCVANGTLEALKWFALVLMTGDHVNKHLFHESLPFVYEAARVVMPLFGVILAYNLARPGAMAAGVYVRTMKRLAFFAALASPFYLGLNGLWPLNVLWMLFLVTAICWCIERNTPRLRALALLLFGIGGVFVEFWWFGMLFCIAVWSYCRSPSWSALILAVVGLCSLTVVNQNWWALAVVPLILLAPILDAHVPRLRWAFYSFYPAHLLVLLIVVHR
jgi:hypothetical protein